MEILKELDSIDNNTSEKGSSEEKMVTDSGNNKRVVPASSDTNNDPADKEGDASVGEEEMVMVLTNSSFTEEISDRRIGNLLFGESYKYNFKVKA